MDFLEKIYYHNTVLEWAIALGIILGGVIVAKILYWFMSTVVKKITSKTKTQLDDLLNEKLKGPVIFIVIIAAYYCAIYYLNFPGEAKGMEKFLFKLSAFALVIDITWMISRTFDALIEQYIVPLTEKSGRAFENQVLPIIRKGIGVIIWIMGIILGMDNLGIDITAMIAGLGIGGLALALAAQEMVKNTFGGIMIFLDKPFKIGDRIQIDGIDGTVEEIGLRRTRVRTLKGRLSIINNSTFSNNTVINGKAEQTRKVVLNLGMTYDTTPEQMEQSMDILKQIIVEHEILDIEESSIGFNAFGDFSLGILFIYRIKKEADMLGIQTEVNLEVLKRFNAAGLEFAFPTQTVFKK
jgi:MscS family membrane protein